VSQAIGHVRVPLLAQRPFGSPASARSVVTEAPRARYTAPGGSHPTLAVRSLTAVGTPLEVLICFVYKRPLAGRPRRTVSAAPPRRSSRRRLTRTDPARADRRSVRDGGGQDEGFHQSDDRL